MLANLAVAQALISPIDEYIDQSNLDILPGEADNCNCLSSAIEQCDRM